MSFELDILPIHII